MLSRMYTHLHVDISYYSQILIKSILSTEFRKNLQISNFLKFRAVGTDLFHADGWTDTTTLIGSFHNFGNAPKMPECVCAFQEIQVKW